MRKRLARNPTDAELAEHLGVSAADLLDAQRADLAFQASSLSAPLSDGADAGTLEDLLGGDDPQLETTLDMEAVWEHLGELPEREQRLLMMRFYGNMTQSEIGDQLGISQMHVSRLLAHALGYLRDRILESGRRRQDHEQLTGQAVKGPVSRRHRPRRRAGRRSRGPRCRTSESGPRGR